MMDNKEFGLKLRKLRENSGLSVKEVVDQLANMDIILSEKTLYGYEKGIRMPNADLFLYLCKIYKCNNILGAFEHLTENVITYSDLKLIEKYHSLDDDGRETIDFILNKEHKRCTPVDYEVINPDGLHLIIEMKNAQKILNAAHAEENASGEDKKHDEDIMDSEDF